LSADEQKRVLREIFGPKAEEVIRYYTNLHNEELQDLILTKYYSGDETKEQIGRACGTHRGNNKHIQDFGVGNLKNTLFGRPRC
jgi:hypothetical protein